MITDEMVAAARNEFIAVSHESYFPSNEQIRCVLEAAERAAWRPISEAPKDGSDFLSVSEDNKAVPHETRFLSPGPYTTENGKNTQGKRRYQWPDGFYWSGYDGFVGPVEPTHFRPFPSRRRQHDRS